MSERLLYLASASPRRRELVGALGLPVQSGVAPFDEDSASAAYIGDISHLAEHLACAKASATVRTLAAELPQGAVVVAADTTVLLNGESLAKPRDDAEAREMLVRLRNRRHLVVTGVAVTAAAQPSKLPSPTRRGAGGEVRSLSVTTQVLMRDYNDGEIEDYIASGDPHDKAGAYGIQHAGFHPVAAIEGCYLAVVGLPLCALTHLLATGGEASEADRQRYMHQEHERHAGRCPWSAACREPLPCWLSD
jgi:MAF protein